MTQEATAPGPIITIDHAGEYQDRAVKLQGWLYNLRESGKIAIPDFSRRHGNYSRRRLA